MTFYGKYKRFTLPWNKTIETNLTLISTALSAKDRKGKLSLSFQMLRFE